MSLTNKLQYTDASSVTRLALRDALGFPVIMLIASMTGFGSLARESGFTLGMALSSTAGIWGLPGQLAMTEMHAAGVSAVFVILAASLANARFMPMSVSFLPLIRHPDHNDRWSYLLVQLLSINSWAAGIRRFPTIEVIHRRRYYVVFAVVCITGGLTGTVIGYFGVSAMPRPAALGLIFLNPLFFTVLLAGSQSKAAIIALIIGIPLGPLFYLLSPEWGLLATGLIGGSLAFWLHQRYDKSDV